MDSTTDPARDAVHPKERYHIAKDDPALNKGEPHKLAPGLAKLCVTLSEALNSEEDMRVELQSQTNKRNVLIQFLGLTGEIRSLVALHCGLSLELIRVLPALHPVSSGVLEWTDDMFNLVIPVYINSPDNLLPKKMAFRIPWPHKIGEHYFPGNGEEKVRSEAATYVWISKNCPEGPISRLRGFGFMSGLSFFEPRAVSFWQRIEFYIRRLGNRLRGHPECCDYIPLRRNVMVGYPYILTDMIDDEEIKELSKTFDLPHTEEQTQNLYTSMSRIMVSLAKLPQPRIGSWTIDDNGRISLSNRPLFPNIARLESWGIPIGISRNRTYCGADSYYLELLSVHDHRLARQANAAFNEQDAREKVKDLILMKSLLLNYTIRSLTDGPFFMQLSDLNPTKLLVDKDWNIKHISNIEWACSLPAGDLLPPDWLSGKAVDTITTGPEYDRFKACYGRFTHILEQEDSRYPLYLDGFRYLRAAPMMNALENGGRFWYVKALTCTNGPFKIFRSHIQPLFDKVSNDELEATVSAFWGGDMTSFLKEKRKEYERYREEVESIFKDDKLSGEQFFEEE